MLTLLGVDNVLGYGEGPLANAVNVGGEYDLLHHPFETGEKLLGDKGFPSAADSP